jgi:hypothetical protein
MRGNGLWEGPGAAGPISLEGDPGAETNGPSAPGRLKAELLGGPIPAGAPARFILAKLEPIFAIGSTCETWVTENNCKREEETLALVQQSLDRINLFAHCGSWTPSCISKMIH